MSFLLKNNSNGSQAEVEAALKFLEEQEEAGFYSRLSIRRPWSKDNEILTGELATPQAYRNYLSRELRYLSSRGAEVTITRSRPKLSLKDPSLLEAVREDEWDFRQKKLFLFRPERMDLSINRLHHYTGTEAQYFQKYVLFTNYHMHTKVFQEMYPDCIRPDRADVQMPAYHHQEPGQAGVSLINIGVGPSNAKTITDHVAVLRPDAMIMVGHCGGLRNHQSIGDFVLASTYMRDDRVLDDILPPEVPVVSNFLLNMSLRRNLERGGLKFRSGTVYTTANRNWEFNQETAMRDIYLSRSLAVDMESATIAANGFRYRIPNATLLCVSDKPLHAEVKLSGGAREFYEHSKQMHLQVALDTIQDLRENYPSGLPNDEMRALNEPLLSGHMDVEEPLQSGEPAGQE
jgi:AMP nucleosidase